jgi:hypothetical protein
MTRRCPSDLALELFLLQPERSPEAKHVSACPDCATRLARMKEEGDEFRQFVFPATIQAVEESMDRRSLLSRLIPERFHWRYLLAPVGALAAVAMFFLVQPSGPPKDYEYGVKGSGMALAVFVNGDRGVSAVPDGAKVPASAALRFKVQPAKDGCWLWILSVDGKGQVSRLYPPQGAGPDLRSAGSVPGGAVLDGQPGPERIYAVCAPTQQVGWSQVRSAVEAAAGGGVDRVRAARDLGGPLSGALQATLLLEKQP